MRSSLLSPLKSTQLSCSSRRSSAISSSRLYLAKSIFVTNKKVGT